MRAWSCLLVVLFLGCFTTALRAEPQDSAADSRTSSSRATARPQEEAATRPALAIVVVDRANRQPIAGARVTYFLPTETAGSAAWDRALQDARFEPILDSLGHEVITDASGRATIPADADPRALIARKDTLVGMQWLVREMEWLTGPIKSPVEIPVAPDLSYRARVVDSAGHPVGGVRVYRTYDGIRGQHSAVSSAPDGLVDIKIPIALQTIERALNKGRQLTPGVNVAVPGVRQPASPNTPGAADAIPEIILPDTGRVTVVIQTEAGKPVTTPTWVGIETLANFQRFKIGPLSPQETTSEGRVAWRVGLTARYVVEASVFGLHFSEAIHGPQNLNEDVAVTFVVKAPRPFLVGRLVAEDGTPVGKLDGHSTLAMRSASGAGTSGDHLFVDSQGRFRILMPVPTASDPETRFRLFLSDGDGSRSSRDGPGWHSHGRVARSEVPAKLLPGDNDLGNLVFTTPPPVASGIVVDESGAPLSGVLVSSSALRRQLETSQPESRGLRWEDFVWTATLSNTDGSFDLRGFVEADEIAIEAESAGFEPLTSAPVLRGTKNIRLTLKRK